MIDVGLLVSMLVAVGLPVAVATRWLPESEGFFDRMLVPLLAGVFVGRIVTVAIDDPGAFARIGDLLIVRSGVEFWPGVTAAVGVFAFGARRGAPPVGAALATVAPLAMLGYAGYEGTCVVRSGCYGPESPIGLSPSGVSAVMVPVGWLAAVFVVLGAVALHGVASRVSWLGVCVGAITIVASVRAVASFWLPHIGDGLSRHHWQSLVVAGCSIPVAVWLGARRRIASPG